MKIVSVFKMIGFIGTIITSIPLFISYISNQSPKNSLIVHLHICLGLLFIIFAISDMIMIKRTNH